jgi:tRNA-dihydrouridine synthase B
LFLIGPYSIGSRTVLAPMAGVSDQPLRSLCAEQGAGLVISEMITADTRLWHTPKSHHRLQWANTAGPRCVQIAGSEPQQLADAARACVDLGAQVIDINMGCPAKKVCNKAAGSALLRDERLVSEILCAVVNSVTVPVTLKIRTGWDSANKNALSIARIAETSGIQALTIHGRTRACRFAGTAEYDTIADVVASVSIPVIANGDINSPLKAKQVLLQTGAQAVMVGRAAQGNPWIFREINAYLHDGSIALKPNISEVLSTVVRHLDQLWQFYGAVMGPRIARKHVGWYIAQHDQLASLIDDSWRQQFNTLTTSEEQLNAVRRLFDRLHKLEDQAA